LLKSDVDGSVNVLAAALLPSPSLLATTAKKTTKDVAQAEVAKVKVNVLTLAPKSGKGITSGRAAAVTTYTSVTKLVVTLTFAGVFQNLVGFVGLFEFGLIAAAVGVQLNSLFAKSFFNLVGAGRFANAQDFVVIALSHLEF
jgi:uncharacterized membrane protein YuzA (DUF378 family)